MAIHHKDKKRLAGNKAFRLLGVSAEGKPYFYWSHYKGEYAAYIGPSSPYGVWGTLDCGTGKRMKPENRVFISDLETAHRLEQLGVFAPCGNCNREEYNRYHADGRYSVDRKVEID